MILQNQRPGVRAMLQSIPKISIGVAVAALLLGAGYLYAVRGEALLLDLAAMARGLFCF
jgi:hypothetical protein